MTSAATDSDCANAFVRLPTRQDAEVERDQVIDRDGARAREPISPSRDDHAVQEQSPRQRRRCAKTMRSRAMSAAPRSTRPANARREHVEPGRVRKQIVARRDGGEVEVPREHVLKPVGVEQRVARPACRGGAARAASGAARRRRTRPRIARCCAAARPSRSRTIARPRRASERSQMPVREAIIGEVGVRREASARSRAATPAAITIGARRSPIRRSTPSDAIAAPMAAAAAAAPANADRGGTTSPSGESRSSSSITPSARGSRGAGHERRRGADGRSSGRGDPAAPGCATVDVLEVGGRLPRLERARRPRRTSAPGCPRRRAARRARAASASRRRGGRARGAAASTSRPVHANVSPVTGVAFVRIDAGQQEPRRSRCRSPRTSAGWSP